MGLLAEFKHAARALARAPALVAVAVASLALGIGANATVFSFVNAIRFRPLPFPAPDALVDLGEANAEKLCQGCAVGTSWPTWQAWRDQARSYAGTGAYREDAYALAGEGTPERVGGAAVTSGVFPVLGVVPVIGRNLAAADEAPGAPGVVLLGYGLWVRRFGADTTIVGRTVRVNGVERAVIGVMPPGFGFPEFASLWVPMGAPATPDPDDRSIGVVARLGEGVSMAAARRELATIQGRLAAEDSIRYGGWTGEVTGLRQDISDDTSGDAFLLALGATAFVLLIACANLANLFLARTAARRRELAVRVALGASRRRVAGHVLAEALLLGLGGGAVGFVLSLWGVRAITDLIDAEMPFWVRLGVDWRFLLFLLLLSVSAALGFGLVPALRAARAEATDTLKAAGTGSIGSRRERRLQGSLAVAQMALAVVLLAGAGLLIKSFLKERRIEDLGYNPRGVLTAHLQLAGPRYVDPTQVRLLEQRVLEGLAGQPMVEAAAVEHHIFLGAFVGGATRVRLEGAPEAVLMGQGPSHASAVSPDYFRLMEIPIVRGRAIQASDGPGAPPVAVVNGAAAKLYWPGADPLGKRFQVDRGPWVTVVGMAGDRSSRPFGRGNTPLVYTAAAQEAPGGVRVLVRFRGDPVTAATTLKAVTRTVDPDEPVEDVMTLEADLARQVSPLRFMAWLLGGLGAIALGLAAIGVYGMMAYRVTRRTREIGIRMALGAEGRGLRREVLLESLRLGALGLLIGIPAAVGLSRLFRVLMFSIVPGDPLVLGATGSLLLGITLLACWPSAHRATRVDPIESLRSE